MSEWSTTSHSTLSSEIVDRFRLSSIERLERLEALWAKVMADPNDTEAVIAIDREVHTLKGESRMVGFTDVDMVAHKLEDVLELSRERGFHINDDVDLVVTMALRFMAMLIRKKAGQTLGGIDLPGFVRQIDSVVRDARRQHPLRGRVPTSAQVKLDPNKQLMSTAVRDRLAGVALDLFLELTATGGRESKRVRRGWKMLRDSLAPPDPIAIAPALIKHEAAARDLANDLCKEVDLEFVLDAEAKTSPAIVEALDVAMLHLIRNAIDHGVEPIDQRVGKPLTATLTVRCTVDSEHVILEISDDGRGVDFERVRARAVALQLLEPDHTPTEAELGKLLFHPGLTTRTVTTDISGRGLGLDIVQSQVAAVGGTVAVRSRAGQGVTWNVVIPSTTRRFPVHRFTVRGTSVPFAIPADWSIAIAESAEGAIDLAAELGIGSPVANPITLELTRGDHTVRIAAASEPRDAEARWLVTTSAETLAGVASIDQVEALILKPELLLHTTGKLAVVDDSEIVREMVAFTLAPLGIEVARFAEPDALFGALAAQPVDIVLLDLSFKGMDIAGTVRRIKQLVPDVEVYLHSDRTPVELARLAEQSHADGHLPKAAGRDQFVARVLRILRTKRAGR